jgi:predicted RNase H-like HicB family nuclease
MVEYHAAYYRVEDGWYMARVLDFPGVVTQGRTLTEARRMLRSGLQDMAEWYMADGQSFPKPNRRIRDKAAAVQEPIRLFARVKTGAAS